MDGGCADHVCPGGGSWTILADEPSCPGLGAPFCGPAWATSAPAGGACQGSYGGAVCPHDRPAEILAAGLQ